MNIQEAIDECKLDMRANRAVPTMQTYSNGLRWFVEYLQEKGIGTDSPIDALTVEHFIKFPLWFARDDRPLKTTSVYLSGVKYFFDWLTINGNLEPNHVQSLRYKKAVEHARAKHESKLPRFPQRGSAEKMIEVVRSMPEESPIKERDIAVILFLASTGCRNSEIVKLKIGDLDMQERSGIVVGKGKKERRVFFSPETANALVSYWEARRGREAIQPVFARHDRGAGKKRIKPLTDVTVRNIVRNVAMLAGIEPGKFTPHYFRHAFAIKMLHETGDLALVQDLLGHVNPAATRVYAKIYPEDLRDAHRKVYG